MITITRSLVRQLRPVFRRALRLTGRDAGPNLVLAAGPDGLRVQAQNSHAAVEHHTPGDLPPGRICVPFALLTDCEGGKAEPVTVEQDRDGSVTAQWIDKKIPQLVRYDSAAGDVPDFPAVPANMAEIDTGLWSALAEATNTTDADSIRYATNCVQLRGKAGKIVATDSRQLLVQSGFSFPWDDDLLVPRSSLFTYRQLPIDVPLCIGRSDNWLTLQTGPWTFHLAIDKERRFPRTEDLIRRPETAVTRLTIAPADAEFLADAIERLPCDDDGLNQAVTVDLNGQVIVRARANDSKVPTELVLTRSSASGEDMRLAIGRTYLARAIQLGFRELCLYGPEVPLQACGENRAYVWAPLGVHGVIQPNNKTVRIDSAASQSQPRTVQTTTPTTRSVITMVKSTKPQSEAANETANGNGNGNGHSQPDAAGPADLIEQAEALRTTLRTALGQVSELVSALKQQKKNTRSVQSALATLRQLERVAL